MAVNATAIWRVRPSGANTNGGGYDPGISGAATDYSQQNAAQATGTHGSGSGTTTFTDATAANFTSAMVGNAINIAGQGVYFVVTFTSATQVVVDRALGTFSNASWSLGGGWADLWTNTNTTANIIVPGNTVFVLGSGTPNPSSYTVDYAYTGTDMAWVSGSTSGRITFANDPATPGYKAPPDTTGGMPVISINTKLQGSSISYIEISGLWIIAASASTSVFASSITSVIHFGCVFDAVSFSNAGIYISSSGTGLAIVGCELFASAGGGGAGAYVILMQGNFAFMTGCNCHDLVGPVIFMNVGNFVITGNIFAKNTGDAIQVGNDTAWVIANNTIDGNTGDGVNLQSGIDSVRCYNNIFSNHTGAGKFGIANTSGNSANSVGFIDYNTYYNNTSNYSNLNAGAHDTALGVTPYVASSTENYTLA